MASHLSDVRFVTWNLANKPYNTNVVKEFAREIVSGIPSGIRPTLIVVCVQEDRDGTAEKPSTFVTALNVCMDHEGYDSVALCSAKAKLVSGFGISISLFERKIDIRLRFASPETCDRESLPLAGSAGKVMNTVGRITGTRGALLGTKHILQLKFTYHGTSFLVLGCHLPFDKSDPNNNGPGQDALRLVMTRVSAFLATSRRNAALAVVLGDLNFRMKSPYDLSMDTLSQSLLELPVLHSGVQVDILHDSAFHQGNTGFTCPLSDHTGTQRPGANRHPGACDRILVMAKVHDQDVQTTPVQTIDSKYIRRETFTFEKNASDHLPIVTTLVITPPLLYGGRRKKQTARKKAATGRRKK